MAKTVLKNVDIIIAGVNLSDNASAVTIDANADEVDTTGFKSSFREFTQGLKDGQITVSFFQNMAAGKVDDTLWPLSVSGAAFTVFVDDLDEPGSDPFLMTSRLFNYSPIAGSVGEASTTDVTFRNAAQLGITRLPS